MGITTTTAARAATAASSSSRPVALVLGFVLALGAIGITVKPPTRRNVQLILAWVCYLGSAELLGWVFVPDSIFTPYAVVIALVSIVFLVVLLRRPSVPTLVPPSPMPPPADLTSHGTSRISVEDWKRRGKRRAADSHDDSEINLKGVEDLDSEGGDPE